MSGTKVNGVIPFDPLNIVKIETHEHTLKFLNTHLYLLQTS